MAKGGKKNKSGGSPANQKSTSVTISAEELSLLEKAKKVVKDGELDREELKKILEDEIFRGMEEKRRLQEKELEKNKFDMEAKYHGELQKKYKDLKKEIDELKNTRDTISSNVSDMQEELDKVSNKINEAENHKKKILTTATEEATKIVERAKKDAKIANREILDEVERQKIILQEEKEELETQQFEIEAKEMQIASKEKRLAKQAEVYETANPDEVEFLKHQLRITREQLEEVRKEYETVQTKLNEITLKQIKTEGISSEELQEMNEHLTQKIGQLEDKLCRYSEYELVEMKRALDAEKEYLRQIENRNTELTESKNELIRLKNSQMEYEQLRAQLDLLKTLNEHLREELDNTKRMLESSVGEICPALTAIDIQQTEENGEEYVRSQERELYKARVMTLPKLVEHIINYAGSRHKPLYYSPQTIRAYIAGMASSHFAILQGMSGTGKTSLPKIFAEAVLGEVYVIPVESSWRDRNELLGYYNDFSKKFTAKEFTCAVYKSGCERNKDTICLIVLDEMNLSRVEYYFADFLSVLEDKPINWKVKLVDTDLRQLPTEITKEVKEELEKEKTCEREQLKEIVEKLYPNMKLEESNETKISSSDKLRLITYLSRKKFKNSTQNSYLVGGPQNLIDGNTVRIPANVWFVGTANRDESTFEITDKVYDRAQVLEFNKRATPVANIHEVEKLYLSFDVLQKMFRNAYSKFEFHAEEYELLIQIEQILQNKFRISYGNRIQDQMNQFVPVYVAAGQGTGLSEDELIREAIDYQLTYKVLRKLEYVEMGREANKEAGDKLCKLFEKNGLKLAKEYMDWKLGGEE